MTARHIAVVASGLILSAPVLATTPRPLDPADRTILNMRLSAAVLSSFCELGGEFPGPHPNLVPLDSILPQLGAELRGDVVAKDGWGRGLRVLIQRPNDFILISFGSDGKPDQPYAEGFLWEGEATSEFAGTDPSQPDRDIIFTEGGFIQRPRRKDGPAKRAAAEMRTLATAIESYAVDNDVYPGPTAEVQEVLSIKETLEPTYIKKLPLFDPWWHPYFVWSDGKSYFIVSGGAEGKLDHPYDELKGDLSSLGKPRATVDDNEDIVFADGQFVRWPAALDTP